MKHFLAYGNSDQASFRTLDVRTCMNYMSVPGTIASYYAEATAAFVLSSQLSYVIDPRTPLFQEWLENPRASHVTLAQQMGVGVATRVGGGQASVNFDPSFYSASVVREVVESLVEFQRNYADRAAGIEKKLNRYSGLLAEALGSHAEGQRRTPNAPSFVLAPYFAVRRVGGPWWKVNERVWEACLALPDAHRVSPVLCVSEVDQLAIALERCPAELSATRFVWVTGFDERRVATEALVELQRAAEEYSGRYQLVNLYGGFFSICLGHAGLWGFNNGLGYSESREWPQLTSTGAAPARYYVRDLHLFLPAVTAEALIESDGSLSCPCVVCDGRSSVSDLGYHELKRHFALARQWELQLAEELDVEDLVYHLEESYGRGRSASLGLPERARPRLGYLERWAVSLGG